MDIINMSMDWARAEVFSSKVIAVISIVVLLGAAGFYVWGKTEVARSFILPLAVAGAFLLVCAGGLFYANKPRITAFQEAYNQDKVEFVKSELDRTAQSDHDLQLIVYKVLPAIAIVAALLIIFVPTVNVRAWAIVLLVLSGLMMTIDANTHKRNADYRTELLKVADK